MFSFLNITDVIEYTTNINGYLIRVYSDCISCCKNSLSRSSTINSVSVISSIVK